MKTWKRNGYQPEVVVVAPPVLVKEPEPIPEPPKLVILECISCGKTATMIFEGTSYCRGCLKDQMRTGIPRRFYA